MNKEPVTEARVKEIAELETERDTFKASYEFWHKSSNNEHDRAEALAAENTRLIAVLQSLADAKWTDDLTRDIALKAINARAD